MRFPERYLFISAPLVNKTEMCLSLERRGERSSFTMRNRNPYETSLQNKALKTY